MTSTLNNTCNSLPRLFVLKKKKSPKPTVVFNTYWKFAAERQEIFFRRLNNYPRPWTQDKVLSNFKFTNAYRAADRVSQYLIKDVIYNGDQSANEVFFRIILFKLFNKIETWNAIEKTVGTISYSNFSFKTYDKILGSLKKQGISIYSGAYIMASGSTSYGYDLKHQNHLKLLEQMMKDSLPEKIQNTKSMGDLYNILLSYPTIGSFLAYQYAIDINYSNLTNFSEMDFVKAGPGARDGIFKCFSSLGDYTEEDIIKMMADNQEKEFQRLNIDFKNLWGRPLQLIDCQNLFCEVDKYSRVAHPNINGISDRKRIKQRFIPTIKTEIDYFLPTKWGLNTIIPIKKANG